MLWLSPLREAYLDGESTLPSMRAFCISPGGFCGLLNRTFLLLPEAPADLLCEGSLLAFFPSTAAVSASGFVELFLVLFATPGRLLLLPAEVGEA